MEDSILDDNYVSCKYFERFVWSVPGESDNEQKFERASSLVSPKWSIVYYYHLAALHLEN